MKDKHSLRKSMLSQRMELSECERTKQNTSIFKHLICDESYLNSKILFIYISVKDEISTNAIINDALVRGKVVCVPKCIGKGIMEAFRINSMDDLTEKFCGIPEPSLSCNKISPIDIDLCVIPALCCDLNGYRLGYGAGYYDRFLPETNAAKVALCSSNRIFSKIPIQEHDVKCDKIITENGVIDCI